MRTGRVDENGTDRTSAANDGSGRFAGDATLDEVFRGRRALGPGDAGPHVERIQEALLVLGFGLPASGVDGDFGEETRLAVRRFQRDVGISPTGRVDEETLRALARRAPPPGRTLERNPQWDRLLADGRLDVTIAHGHYEENEGRTLAQSIGRLERGLEGQGFSRIEPERLDEIERRRLGLDPGRLEPGVTYFHRTAEVEGRRVEVVVAVITPDSTSPQAARDRFARALGRDEVVAYIGHARYGTGPDFDPIDSLRGNFVIDRDGGPTGHPHAPLTTALERAPESMLPTVPMPRDGYQLLFFQACTTENYLPNLRDPAMFPGRDARNTDIIGTTIPMRIATAPEHVLAFVSMLVDGRSINSFVNAENAIEAAYIRRLLDEGYDVDGLEEGRARGAFIESGFTDNSSNRVR